MSTCSRPSPAKTLQPAEWLHALRFHLAPTPADEYRFSHVHLYGAWTLTRRESSVQFYLMGRTIGEALDLLQHEENTRLDGPRLDPEASAELYQYLVGLAQQLPLNVVSPA